MKLVLLLPTLPIKMPDLNMLQCARIDTADNNGNTIRILWMLSLDVERSNATNIAEQVLGRMRAKGVGVQMLLGLSQELELCFWDYKGCGSPHGTV